MSEFVFLFRATEAGRREALGTPERAQRSLQAWLAWIRDLEAKDLLLGFIVIEARDLAQAVELSAGCPIVEGGGSVEIRPVGTLAV